MILILSIVISVSTSFIDWTLLLLFDYLDLTVSKFSLNNGLYVLWSRVRQIMRLRISAPSLLLNIHRLDLSWFLLVQFIANADGNDHSNENNKDNPKNNMSCLGPNRGNRFGVKNLEVHLAFDELADVILVLWRLQNIDVLLVDWIEAVGALDAYFVVETTSDVLVWIHVERHTSGHSEVSLNIWTLAVVVQDPTVVDWAILVIPVVKEGLPSVPDELWSNCFVERNFIL